jgi:hypothetical protein
MSYVSNSATATSSSGSATCHSAQAENVHVRSVVQTETQSKVSMENTKKISDLMSRLGKMNKSKEDFICISFFLKDQHIFKLMNILVDVRKKLVKLFLNLFEKLLPKLNNINNNFLLMPIYAQRVLILFGKSF